MGLAFILLSVVLAVIGYKRKVAYWWGGAGAMLWFAWCIGSDDVYFSFWNVLSVMSYGALYGNGLYLLACMLTGFIGFKVYLKLTGQGVRTESTANSSMWLVVGRVVDTQTTETVLSRTHVSRDAFGNIGSHTSHDVYLNHNTWLHDLNSGTEVNYSGSGRLAARPGHVIGTMSWGGMSFLDINYSTKRIFKLPCTSTNPFFALLMALGSLAFGFVLFPVMMAMVPLSWKGVVTMKGGGGALSQPMAPGAREIEWQWLLASSAVYLVGALSIFSALQARSWGIAVGLLGVVFVCLYGLMQYALCRKKKQELALMAEGERLLDELYESGMAKLQLQTQERGASCSEPQPA